MDAQQTYGTWRLFSKNETSVAIENFGDTGSITVEGCDAVSAATCVGAQ